MGTFEFSNLSQVSSSNIYGMCILDIFHTRWAVWNVITHRSRKSCLPGQTSWLNTNIIRWAREHLLFWSEEKSGILVFKIPLHNSKILELIALLLWFFFIICKEHALYKHRSLSYCCNTCWVLFKENTLYLSFPGDELFSVSDNCLVRLKISK